MKQEWYNQCKLRNGSVYSVAFIPSKFAVVGKELVITNDGKKEDWTVFEVYSKVDGALIVDQAHKSGCIWTATSGKYPRGNK